MQSLREATTKRQWVKTERNTETTEVNESDNMIVTRDERPGHRMLADDVIDSCHFSSTPMLEVEVRPKCDMDAGKPDGNETENDAVRPKRDMDAEKIVNVNDAVRPECDEEAAAGDEDAAGKHEKKARGRAAAAKKILEEHYEVTSEDVKNRRLIEEMRNIARGEQQHVKEVSKQIRKCIKGKKRYSESLKSS